MPIWETLSLISSVVIISWIAYGPGPKPFRLAFGGGLFVVVLLCWALVYSGRLSESISSVFVQIAVLFSVVMLLLPVAFKCFTKHGSNA
jgi:hypothetical protein